MPKIQNHKHAIIKEPDCEFKMFQLERRNSSEKKNKTEYVGDTHHSPRFDFLRNNSINKRSSKSLGNSSYHYFDFEDMEVDERVSVPMIIPSVKTIRRRISMINGPLDILKVIEDLKSSIKRAEDKIVKCKYASMTGDYWAPDEMNNSI